VASLHAEQAERVPVDVLDVFEQERQQLGRAGVPQNAAKPGRLLPDAKLLDARGEPTTLSKALRTRPAVIVTYRGAWCPYCNLALRAYQTQVVPTLAELGIELISISPQKPDGSLTMQEVNDLTFTVLSDPGNQIPSQLGILSSPRSSDARQAEASLGIDVAAVNADGTDLLPMPATIIVDEAGTIRWVDVHPDYSKRTEPPGDPGRRRLAGTRDERRARTVTLRRAGPVRERSRPEARDMRRRSPQNRCLLRGGASAIRFRA
jgi:peroxiredoxin